MKLGIGSNYLYHYGFDKGLALMKKQGYECLDYGMSDTEGGAVYRFSEHEFESGVADLRARIDGAGITVHQTHGPWRWPPHDGTEEERAERFEKMARSIRATSLLGCENFVIHPIMPFGDNADPDPRRLWEMNLEFFSRLLPVAEANKVVICYENMPMKKLSNSRPEAILRFAREMNSPYFKVCLDTGHCAVFGDSPADAVRLIGREYLRVLHIHDNDGHGDRHWVPGTGVINWDDFALSLRQIGYDGCASLETFIPDTTPADERPAAEEALFMSLCRIAGRI